MIELNICPSISYENVMFHYSDTFVAFKVKYLNFHFYKILFSAFW